MTAPDVPSSPAPSLPPDPGPRGTEAGTAPRAPTSASDWVRRFAEALGAPAPDDDEVDAVLGLAGVAAHASERTAAPLSAWLAGRAGITAADARALAQRLAADLDPGAGPRA